VNNIFIYKQNYYYELLLLSAINFNGMLQILSWVNPSHNLRRLSVKSIYTIQLLLSVICLSVNIYRIFFNAVRKVLNVDLLFYQLSLKTKCFTPLTLCWRRG
jgi:hypothetical protein